MAALFFTIDPNMRIMIIPDTQAHANGHAIITYTYSIYKDVSESNPKPEQSKESELHLQKHTHPNYLGFITFEDPNRLFTYTPDGREKLTSDQIEEIIEHISHYRDHPGTWRHLNQ